MRVVGHGEKLENAANHHLSIHVVTNIVVSEPSSRRDSFR